MTACPACLKDVTDLVGLLTVSVGVTPSLGHPLGLRGSPKHIAFLLSSSKGIRV